MEKKFYYVLVCDDQDGPKFVTGISGRNAIWDECEIPLNFTSLERATDIANGLYFNGKVAYPVVLERKVDFHPYNYNDYKIEFVRKEGSAAPAEGKNPLESFFEEEAAYRLRDVFKMPEAVIDKYAEDFATMLYHNSDRCLDYDSMDEIIASSCREILEGEEVELHTLQDVESFYDLPGFNIYVNSAENPHTYEIVDGFSPEEIICAVNEHGRSAFATASIAGAINRKMRDSNKKIHAYCNCCGTEFMSYEDKIKCPQCECEYSDENDYIEIYGY